MINLSVYPCSKELARYMVKRYHYADRNPSISQCFGLREGNKVVGTCIFSIPASYTLCKGLCGEKYKTHVLELSRLVIRTDTFNAGSWFVSRCLRMIGNKIVVSYADCNSHVSHIGFIYQSLNFLYTGQGDAEPIWINPKDGSVVSYTRRWIDKKAESLGLHWQELEKQKQLGKHRYVTFTGDRRFTKKAKKALKYLVLPYPKGDTKRHEIDRLRDLD